MNEQETTADLVELRWGPLDGHFAQRAWIGKDGFMVRRIRLHAIDNVPDEWRIAPNAMRATRRVYYQLKNGRLQFMASESLIRD